MRQNNYLYLLAGLLILMIAAAAAAEFPEVGGTLIVALALPITLLLGVWSLLGSRLWFFLGIVLALAEVVCAVTDTLLGIWELRYVSLVVSLLFFVLSTVIAIYHVLLQGVVDFNKIVGSICIYFMLGLIWALLYIFVHAAFPGSFEGVLASAPDQELFEFIYYSYVTLSTLGYGDITPVRPVARTLAYLEATCGQFYIAVLVAALVGMHIASRQSSEQSTE